MTRDVVCITADVPDLRTCTVRGEHLAHCDGFAKRWDRDTAQTVSAEDVEFDESGVIRKWLIECPGCMPRRAQSGRLCATHTGQIEHTFEPSRNGAPVVLDLVTHLWSTMSNGSASSERVSGSAPGSRWPLAESRIAAAEIIEALLAYAYPRVIPPRVQSSATVEQIGRLAGDAVDRVQSVGERLHRNAPGAERAVRLVNAESSALGRFSLIEPSHRVANVRCPKCGRLELVWHPPLRPPTDVGADPVNIRCDHCQNTETQEWLEIAIHALANHRRATR